MLTEENSPGDPTIVVKPYLKFVKTLSKVSGAVFEAHRKSQYNKKICGALLTRVEFTECVVKSLVRDKEDHVEDFCNQNYYESFVKFANVMKRVQKFVEEISQLSQLKRFNNSQSIKDMLRTILEDFDTYSSELRLQVSFNTEKDMKTLNDDLEQIKFLVKSDLETEMNENQDYNEKFMTSLSTVQEQFKTTNYEIDNSKVDLMFQVNNIPSEQLKKIPNGVDAKRETVIRRRYKGMDVAGKKVNIGKDDEIQAKKFKARVAILEKLCKCDSIIQFYGMSNIDGEDYMIYRWAERHSLKEVYEKKKFTLCEKSSIALDICRGLVFLNATGIYHHDIRCENILMTARWEPKIANFKFAKEKETETPEKNHQSSVNWMAPEKMVEYLPEGKKYSYSYTAACEIFSFGMLLWELKYERIPYIGKKIEDLIDHVRSQEANIWFITLFAAFLCELLTFSVVFLAWEHEPDLRIEIGSLFNEIQKLNACSKRCEDIAPAGTTHNLESTSTIKLIPPIEDGIKAYNKKNYKLAFDIFEANAKAENTEAKFWVGEFYWRGNFVEKDRYKALEYYEKAAKDGYTKAKFQYAISFINLYFDDESFLLEKRRSIISNLRTAAYDNHAEAAYLLGEIYREGKLSIKVKKPFAKSYYELTILNGHKKAGEALKKLETEMKHGIE
ncbi:718_t:CDS:2 [Acaulospora morrowiae]|uniref:718_t:CDS:1 n=1 Tax=Acaulospora morrowiae TaxID=94023 RepID=A0A9N9FGN2_9GLOM|nr:718_t:CDS:2 [Acaulospora morrowiae]